MPAPHDRVREVLHRVDRLTVAADQHAEIRPGTGHGDHLVRLVEVDPRRDTDAVDDAGNEGTHLGRELRLVARTGRDGVRVDDRDHLRRGEAHAEQAALALGHDLEADRRLVDAGVLLLELPQRSPLGLAHRLTGRLDLNLHQRRAFFFRFTRRGWLLAGLAAGSGSASGSPGVASFGGVREDRFGPEAGGATFGISRRVIRPCPTVHRFVVIQ